MSLKYHIKSISTDNACCIAHPGRTHRTSLPKRSWPTCSGPLSLPPSLPLSFYITNKIPQYIDEIALNFPSLSIICGHIGFPWTQEMIGVAWKHPNVYIDTSAYLPKYYPPVRTYTHLSSGLVC